MKNSSSDTSVWFRRWGALGYKPVNNRGRRVIAWMLAGVCACVAGSVAADDFLRDALGVLAVLVALFGHYIVLKHIE